MAGGDVWDLYAKFREQGWSAGTVAVAHSLTQAWDYVAGKLRRGHTLLIVGAGDVEKIGTWARKEIGGAAECCRTDVLQGMAESVGRITGLKVRSREALSGKTTFGLGGEADIWVEVVSEDGLGGLLAWCSESKIPFHLLGAGSNVLVSDLGVRGVTARLAGEAFRRIDMVDENAGEVTVRVGAGVAMAVLAERLERESLSGLEFLEGIPGSVGGGLRMNAGAMGDEIGAHVSSIRCLNMDGSQCTVHRDGLRFSYRCCESLRDRIAVECTLTVTRGRAEEIASRRREFREKRRWMSGLRCAGSVFRNPPGGAAGRIVDETGLKGTGVGGATVSAGHANVIVAERGACASDVLALIEKVRAGVFERCGVLLENEVMVLG